MYLFQFAIIFKGDSPKIIKDVTSVLALSYEEVKIRASRDIPEEYMEPDMLREIDIMINSFLSIPSVSLPYSSVVRYTPHTTCGINTLNMGEGTYTTQ